MVTGKSAFFTSGLKTIFIAVLCAMLLCGAFWGCTDSTTDDEATSNDDASDVALEEVNGISHVSDELNTTTLFFFDTVLTISAYCDNETLDAVAEQCEYFDNAFSRTIEGSDVWNINHAEGSPTVVDEKTADIIARALEYAEQTDGLFDITIGAVSSLWDFVEGIKPDDEDIRAAVEHVDWHCVEVEGNTVTLSDPEAMIDLGGIAKGYIADYIKQMLEDAGITSATINLGGDVSVLGEKPDGTLYNVGIQDPNGATDEVIASIRTNESVVTSGLYERAFTEDGIEYYHILDPKTGYPVATDLESVSILSGSATDADVWATTAFLMGSTATLDFLNSDDRFQGLLVDKDGSITTSSDSSFLLL